MLCVTLKILLVLKNISLHCINCPQKKIGATKYHLYCSSNVYSLCNILMQWGPIQPPSSNSGKRCFLNVVQEEAWPRW